MSIQEGKKKWLTIKEASAKYGKHPDTIRNLIKKNPESTKKEEGEKGKIFIDAGFLDKHFNDELRPNSEETADESLQSKGNSQILEALLKQLNQKDEEINRLHTMLEKLTEQQNQLIGQQQQLSGMTLQLPTESQATEQAKTKKKGWFRRKSK